MIIPQEAIEAASRILSGEKEYYDTWDEARDILTAALPALERQIREQVMEEILANTVPNRPTLIEKAVNSGMKYAAQIARGEDQP